jgi:hypothetical protein
MSAGKDQYKPSSSWVVDISTYRLIKTLAHKAKINNPTMMMKDQTEPIIIISAVIDLDG